MAPRAWWQQVPASVYCASCLSRLPGDASCWILVESGGREGIVYCHRCVDDGSISPMRISERLMHPEGPRNAQSPNDDDDDTPF